MRRILQHGTDNSCPESCRITASPLKSHLELSRRRRRLSGPVRILRKRPHETEILGCRARRHGGARHPPHPDDGHRGRHPSLPGPDGHVVLGRERRNAVRQRRRRRHGHPLVLCRERRPVAPGRPRRHRLRHPGGARLGGGLRQGLQDPALPGREHLDRREVGHRRRRRHRHARRLGPGPLCPHAGRPPGHPLGLLAVGVPGLRHHRRHRAGRFLRHRQRRAGQARIRLLGGERRDTGRRGLRRRRRHPLVQPGRRPAVGARRPRRRTGPVQGGPELGGRLRQGLPDRGVLGRAELADTEERHRRHRRQGLLRRQRFGPLRPRPRHGPRHRVRLLAVGGRRAHRHHRHSARRGRRRPGAERHRRGPRHAEPPAEVRPGLRPAGVEPVRQRALPVPDEAGHLQRDQRPTGLLHLHLRSRPQPGRHADQR
ncbi:hypothetical protein RKD48_000385 [Streptomyces ambofaciens]